MAHAANWEDRIETNPSILAGKPVIKGTRLSVEFIIGLMAEGWQQDELLSNYPQLSRDDILAALQWAREVLESEKVHPLPRRSS